VNTWNLDEERRERKEKDDRHAPQIEVARCTNLRRRHLGRCRRGDRTKDPSYASATHGRVNRTTNATTTQQLWCIAISRRPPTSTVCTAPPPPVGSALSNALLLLPLLTLRHSVKYNQHQPQQQQQQQQQQPRLYGVNGRAEISDYQPEA